jgi:hypothetical protein
MRQRSRSSWMASSLPRTARHSRSDEASGSSGSCSTKHDESPSRIFSSPSSSCRLPGNDVQQRRLARAVAPDQSDALCVADGQVRAIEQGLEAEASSASCCVSSVMRRK